MADFSQPGLQAALYKECVGKAASDGRQLMEQLVDKSRQAMQQRSATELDSRERMVLNEAVKQLNMHERLLCERFPISLEAEFSEALTAETKPRGARGTEAPGASVRFDELELMDEGQIQESIELARAQQNALAMADLQLAELNGLVCAVLGLKTVQPDRNPLRPEVYVKAMRTVLMLTNADNGVRVRWLQAMGMALGPYLRAIYPELSELLRNRGVKPVGYVVTQTVQAGNPQAAKPAGAGGAAGGNASGGGGGGGGSGGGGGGRGAGGGAGGGASGTSGTGPQYGAQALLTVDQLRRLLAGELDFGRPRLAPAEGGGGGGAGRGFGGGGGGSGGGGGIGFGGGRAGGPGGGGGGAGGFSAGFANRGGAGGPNSGGVPLYYGPGGQGGDEPPPPDFANTVPAAFDALEEMRQVDRVIQRLSERPPRGSTGAAPPSGNAGLDTTLDTLRRNAQGVGQALGLEVVNLMFENISLDPHILPPVQAVLRRAEAAYLRLALIDPRFFSDKQHVARRLLDEMTQRSLAYATVLAPGFDNFLASLRSVADVLAISQVNDVSPFEYALGTLQADWQRQERREAKQREKAVHALLHAEQRNLLAERLAADLRNKPGANMAPSEVISFVCGPWSQVLAEARLADRKGATDPGGYMSVANDLIWTTQPEQSRSNRARIQELMPQMLARLREGLELIAFPQVQIDNFGLVLMGIYDSVLEGTGRESVMPSQDSGSQGTGQDSNDPWLAPAEMQHSGFLEMGDERAGFGPTEQDFENTAPQDEPALREVRPAERSRTPIPPGAWVELALHDQTLRAQLTWSSPYGTLFMFTDSAGTTHSLTRRALDKLLARGSVTVISQGLVDNALDAVAKQAMNNSLDLNL